MNFSFFKFFNSVNETEPFDYNPKIIIYKHLACRRRVQTKSTGHVHVLFYNLYFCIIPTRGGRIQEKGQDNALEVCKRRSILLEEVHTEMTANQQLENVVLISVYLQNIKQHEFKYILLP